MTPVLTNDKDYSISFIRLTAMLFIFSCHILQKYNNILGGWLDCGVQMFFFISGFLYSTKIIYTVLSFYKKQFIKILSDYYIFIILVFTLSFLLQQSFDITQFVSSLVLLPHLNGTGHLWFIRYILTCYLLLPIFVFILNKLQKIDNKFYILNIILFAILIEFIFSFIFHIKGAWLVCFMLGMVYKRLKQNKDNINQIIFTYIILLLAFIFIALRLFCYYKYINLNSFYYDYIWQYCHIFLGISIAIIIRYFYLRYFDKIAKSANKYLNISDKYSYDFYIVHYVFVLNTFSIYFLNSEKIYIAILLCFSFSLIASLILYNISFLFKKKFSNIVFKAGANK